MPVLTRCLPFLILCAMIPADASRGLAGEESSRFRHDLTVVLLPEDHRLEVEDVVSVPSRALSGGSLHFVLHAGLQVESADPGYVVEALPGAPQPEHFGIDEESWVAPGVPLREYRLSPSAMGWPTDPRPRLEYHGDIHHSLVAEKEEYARSFSRTPAVIGAEGVMLSGDSFWVPWFGKELVSFSLDVTVPEGWDVVSQGERTRHAADGVSRQVRWECPDPMDEVYLIGGRFTEYSRPAGNATAYAFLREPAPKLAAKYLEATAQFIEMYSRLIGPYPYKKFALVENFWETGYGMPSFTLLGPTVIRLPFILGSSYPHEILHNWWGNSVFVDYEQGNWSEGLTAYLADHLMKEARGKGIEYRRNTLIGYRSYVREGRDFPLRDFRSRHSSTSEAVGYGKSLMLWHMLRLHLGDERFVRGLRIFFLRHRFRRASFSDLRRVYSELAGEDLQPFFQQWVERTGAPVLSFESEALGEDRIRVVVRQEQRGELYELSVPLAVTLAGETQARIFSLSIQKRESEFEFTLPAAPLRVDLDPYFDVFRRLDQGEIPPTLSDLFGAEKVTLVLPEREGEPAMAAWKDLAHAWQQGAAGQVEAVHEQGLQRLPEDRAVWVLGSHNQWSRSLRPGLEALGAGIGEGAIRIGAKQLPEKGHSFVYTTRRAGKPHLPLAWVGADSAAAIRGLARKLPHYGKYSYLAFSGEEPSNVVKGQWQAIDSPLVRVLAPAEIGDASDTRAGASVPPRAALPPREALAQPGSVFDPARLTAHIGFLAGDLLEGRGVGTAGLEKAGDYIATEFRRAGLEPGGDEGGYFQSWIEPDGPDGKPVTLRNVVGVLAGGKAEWKRQSVVLGSHYDHLGRGWPDVRAADRGEIFNGADDNASGVAVLLEVAAVLAKGAEPDRSIVFVAFTGEEWGRRGSRHYVSQPGPWPAEASIAMVNLDSVGRLGGKKLLILGAGTAREWVHIVRGVGFETGIEADSILDDPGGSDQASFHEVAVPAVQIFSGAHADYHRPSDDIEKIDVDGLLKVARFVREVLAYLSAREDPLNSNLDDTASRPDSSGAVSPRRAGLGTVPDFSFSGPGVRVSSVLEGSAAAAAGIQQEDVLVAIDGEEIRDLRAYADVLRKHLPGDLIRIKIMRGKDELNLEAKLAER
ncbi:MAG: M20/M25/M40 family metallo-hydrolase [Deltaproteobacteria bacterium]|nr:M20/M25/M40 family metallo-hydrolase [Deltaproteobacteria bacterium]